jgi:methylthioribose-1-phosphate isomerase
MSPDPSPLFEPVLWHGQGFKILDETQVPDKIEYLNVGEIAEAIAAVREMKTRAFGQVLTFLYSGALLAQKNAGESSSALRCRLAEMTEQFCAARPTFDFRGLGYFFDGWCDQLHNGAAAGPALARLARECAQTIVRARQMRAERAARVLPSPALVLTHCNVSGELVAVAQCCSQLGKQFKVIACETRPYLQGARLTGWELAEAGITVSMIPDCAVAQVICSGEVNAVIVGADRTARNGDIVNKVGTYPIARLAHEYGVPFYALVQDPRSLGRGADIVIEERPGHELLMFRGQPLIPGEQGHLRARYPSFDVTPARFISFLVGFDGVYTPEAFRRKYQGELEVADDRGIAKGKYVLIYGLPRKDRYSFLISALEAEQGGSFLVPEMRPQLWGAQVVTRQLLERKAPSTLISDNMMGTLFAQREIVKLCLFYDRLTEQGPGGICGSLLAVQLARLHGVPVELCSGDRDVAATFDDDVSTFMGRRTCPPGVGIRALQSEVVPWDLLRTADDATRK